MKFEFLLASRFGTFPAEGSLAAEFRLREIEPFFHTYDSIILDFAGVRNVNSSFANALIVPVVEQHGDEALAKLRFRHCNPIVRVLIEGALSLGLQKARENGLKVSA
ncbi:MAG: STAS-like domain-containing protein [Opitutaceae bacterium]